MNKKRKINKSKSKGNGLRILVPIMIFIIGAGIFLYPAVSNYLVSRDHERILDNYSKIVTTISKEDLSKYWEEARIYNDNLAGDPLHDPFVEGSGYVIPDNYNDVLNVNGDGVMCRISIPKIAVNLPVYHGTSEEVLEKGAGHIEVTSLPIGGINRHSVISAHRGLPSALLFTRLDEMKIGDYFFIDVLDEKLAYQVDDITVIDPSTLKSFDYDTEKDLVTLMTCTPYGVNTHRLLVRGHRVEMNEEVKEAEHDEHNMLWAWIQEYLLSIVVGVVLSLIMLIILLLHRKKR